MNIDDALAVFIIYQWGISIPEEIDKTLEICLIFWIFCNSNGFQIFQENNGMEIYLEDVYFTQQILERINLSKIFPMLA